MFPNGVLEYPWQVISFSEIDSTSLEAARRAASGEVGPIWFQADTQSGGRGRLGRKWVSNSGNLYATALLPLNAFDDRVPCLALAAGLAVSDLVKKITGDAIQAGLKWPNDVRINGAKLCGILLECGRNNQKQNWLSIGIGINLNHAPDVENYSTTSLSKEWLFPVPSVSETLSDLDECLRMRFQQLISSGRAAVISDWMKVTDQIGQECRTTINGAEVHGKFIGLDEQGLLQLKTSSGETLTVSAGDVELVKEAKNAARN